MRGNATLCSLCAKFQESIYSILDEWSYEITKIKLQMENKTWYHILLDMSNKIPAKFVEVSYTSLEIIWESWFLGPFNAKNEPIMHPQPSVKQMANFWGTKTMAGRKIVKAMNTRKMPLVNKRPKYINDLPDGTLLVADWKLPGSSLTPFVTLHYLKNK